MWGCPPQQYSPFSWPREGGKVEDYARRGDEIERYFDLRIGGLEITPSPISEVRNDEQTIRVREHGR